MPKEIIKWIPGQTRRVDPPGRDMRYWWGYESLWHLQVDGMDTGWYIGLATAYKADERTGHGTEVKATYTVYGERLDRHEMPRYGQLGKPRLTIQRLCVRPSLEEAKSAAMTYYGWYLRTLISWHRECARREALAHLDPDEREGHEPLMR